MHSAFFYSKTLALKLNVPVINFLIAELYNHYNNHNKKQNDKSDK